MRLDDQTLAQPPRDGTRRVALELLAEADAAADRLEEGSDPEALHDFRVALRRLRSILRAYRPWLGGAVKRRHEKRLAKIAASTNQARDAEVQLAWLLSQQPALAQPREHAGYAWLWERFEPRTRPGRPGGRPGGRVLRRYRRAARKLRRRLGRRAPGAGGPRTTGGALADLLRGQLAAFRARLESVAGPGDLAGVHRARIEAKRLRYLLEPLRGHPGADASVPVERLKDAQDLLGTLHDAHVLGAELADVLALISTAQTGAWAGTRDPGADGARSAPEPDARPGIMTLVRRLEGHRDALFATVAQRWDATALDALAAAVEAVAGGLDASQQARV